MTRVSYEEFNFCRLSSYAGEFMFAIFRKSLSDGPLTLSFLAWQEIFGGGYFYRLNTKCVCRNWTRAIYCWFARDVTAAMLVPAQSIQPKFPTGPTVACVAGVNRGRGRRREKWSTSKGGPVFRNVSDWTEPIH